MTWELAELRQMLSAPSDAYSAGAWCETANHLLVAVDALSVRLAQAEQERDEAQGTAEVLSGHLAATAEKLHVAEVRLREYEEALTKMRDALSRYPEMTDAEAADAAGVVAGLLFSEQGAASGGREAP